MKNRLILLTSLATLMVASQAESGKNNKYPRSVEERNIIKQSQKKVNEMKEIADKFALKAKEELAEKKALAQENEDLSKKLSELAIKNEEVIKMSKEIININKVLQSDFQKLREDTEANTEVLKRFINDNKYPFQSIYE